MHTQVLDTTHPDALPRALAVLQSGGLVAFPTDTVYGLAAATFSAVSIDRLYEAKTREALKAIAVLIGDLDQLAQLTTGMTGSAQRLAQRFWPGALTLVIPKHPKLPPNISTYPTIGVRMPDHEFARLLLRKTGPLATTSANISGGSNTLTTQDVLSQLDGRIELVLDGGTCPGGVPSTVVDCSQTPPAVLRQGAIAEDQILAIINA